MEAGILLRMHYLIAKLLQLQLVSKVRKVINDSFIKLRPLY